jgi:16S rRNA (guanine527-N7)-methyltransferase
MSDTVDDSFDSTALTRRLESGLAALDVQLPGATIDQLIAFLGELHRWNKTYNLTAVRDPVEMVSRHLLDSLSAQAFIAGEQVLDVGSGAGLPGIPLALAQPATQFWLLDSNGKKQRFVEHVCRELALPNVHTVHARVEAFQPEQLFDTVICRALAALPEFVSNSEHLLKPDGRFVAMKGKLPEQEIADLAENWRVKDVSKTEIPALSGERHIVVIVRR